MTRQERTLRLYGARSGWAALEWSWVDEQLASAGTYWVIARNQGPPHPRPVWGVWQQEKLHLSLGSPTLREALRQDPAVTIHLDSGTDVVILEGVMTASVFTGPGVLEAYDQKYDWQYDAPQYGELLQVEPRKVLAWRTAGPAGRESFQTTGCWIFDRSL